MERSGYSEWSSPGDTVTAHQDWSRSDFEATWVEKPPSKYGLQDPISWEYELTNLTDTDLDSSGQYVWYDDAGGLTLEPVFVPANSTVTVVGSLDARYHDMVGASSPGNYDLNIGVAGPSQLFSVPVEIVEGSILGDQPTADKSKVEIVDCQFGTQTRTMDSSFEVPVTVANNNDVAIQIRPAITIGNWSWNEQYTMDANEQKTFRVPVDLRTTDLSDIGGYGTYDVQASIFKVEAI